MATMTIQELSHFGWLLQFNSVGEHEISEVEEYDAKWFELNGFQGNFRPPSNG